MVEFHGIFLQLWDLTLTLSHNDLSLIGISHHTNYTVKEPQKAKRNILFQRVVKTNILMRRGPRCQICCQYLESVSLKTKSHSTIFLNCIGLARVSRIMIIGFDILSLLIFTFSDMNNASRCCSLVCDLTLLIPPRCILFLLQGSDEDFEKVYEQCQRCCRAFLEANS